MSRRTHGRSCSRCWQRQWSMIKVSGRPNKMLYGFANRLIVKYILNKGTIAGPTMKMPFIGPFLESMNPQFERYLEKWASGPLSCVSVFHKYVA